MSKIRRNSRFLVAALLMVSIVTVTMAQNAPVSQQLAPSQEMATVGGGFWCDFNDGVAVGMGVATLFGCVWCGAAAVVGGIVHVIAC